MKKHIIIFFLIFFVTIGFATLSTVLDIKGNVNIAENLEDFKIEITNLKINNDAKVELISANKKAFTFTGTGNDTLEYTVTNYSYQYDTNINLVCTPADNVTIEQINNLSAQNRITKTINTINTSEITCTINVEKISRTDYAEDICIALEGTEWEFNYTGAEQEFAVPCDGEYMLETWGAQGGNISGYNGGYGGYSSGNILLNKDQEIYINVGGKGKGASSRGESLPGGYNGGGSVIGNDGLNHINASGGGASHIATKSGSLSSLENYLSEIIIVSGGGGGARDQANHSTSARWGNGGSGGGFKSSGAYSNNDTTIVTQQQTCIATQTSGNLFGQGGSGTGNSGGGGGFYGGFFGGTINSNCNYLGCGSGGSGYIGNYLLTNKVMYCYNCEQSTEESTKTISTTCTNSSPIANCAKQGDGYAKITYLGK